MALNSDPFLLVPNDSLSTVDSVDEESVHQNSLYGNPVDLVFSQCLPPNRKNGVEDAVSDLRENFHEFTLNCVCCAKQLLTS